MAGKGFGRLAHKGWGKRWRNRGCEAARDFEAPSACGLHGTVGCGLCPVGCSLNDAAPGTTCRIRKLCGCGPVRQRLLDLGLHPCREVTVIRAAPLRDPIELQIGDSFIVLRRREAAQVEVENA